MKRLFILISILFLSATFVYAETAEEYFDRGVNNYTHEEADQAFLKIQENLNKDIKELFESLPETHYKVEKKVDLTFPFIILLISIFGVIISLSMLTVQIKKKQPLYFHALRARSKYWHQYNWGVFESQFRDFGDSKIRFLQKLVWIFYFLIAAMIILSIILTYHHL